MSILISSIYYSPVKSLSFQNVESCRIKKDLGILNDRMFALSRIIVTSLDLSFRVGEAALPYSPDGKLSSDNRCPNDSIAGDGSR